MANAECVPVRITEPCAAGRTELGDVPRRSKGTLRIVEELRPLRGQVVDHRLDIIDFEVGKCVLGCGGRTLEDRDLTDGAATVPDACRSSRRCTVNA